jgi:hypothetical protein
MTAPSNYPSSNFPVAAPQRKRSKLPWAIAILGALLMLLACFGVVGLIVSGDPQAPAVVSTGIPAPSASRKPVPSSPADTGGDEVPAYVDLTLGTIFTDTLINERSVQDAVKGMSKQEMLNLGVEACVTLHKNGGNLLSSSAKFAKQQKLHGDDAGFITGAAFATICTGE